MQDAKSVPIDFSMPTKRAFYPDDGSGCPILATSLFLWLGVGYFVSTGF
jgi:hypothetical protein